MTAIEVFVLFGLALAALALTAVMVVRYLWSVLSNEISAMIATAIVTAEYTMATAVSVELDDDSGSDDSDDDEDAE